MAKSLTGKASSTLVWILMALLFVGLAGFGTTQFSGGVDKAAAVGDHEITVNDYARGLDQALNNMSAQLGTRVTFSQAQNFGISQQVISQLLVAAALDNETNQIGISAGDARVSREIQGLATFRGIDGTFDRDLYQSNLQRLGYSVSEFEGSIRDEIARNILETAVAGGVDAPDTTGDAFLDYIATRRDISVITLTAADLPGPVAAPTDAELRAFFDEVGGDYVVPETRQITFISLTPAMLADGIDVDEADLRAAYEARADEFNRPERRLVERLIFEDEGTAQAALGRIAAGEVTFDALVEERGLTLADADLGDVTKADLGDAGAAVFAVTDTGESVIAPTPFGPAIFRVNAILYAQTTPFEDARDQLARDEALEIATRDIADMTTTIDDLLAEGATLEDVARETAAELGTIALTGESTEGLAADATFRAAAREVTSEDFPQVDTLRDGGIFALRLDRIDAERPQTFDEAAEALRAAWIETRTREALEALAAGLEAGIADTDTLSGTGRPVQTHTGLTRQSALPGLPTDTLVQVFDMDPQETRVISQGAEVHLVRLDAVLAPDITDETVAAQRRALNTDIAQSIARDIYALYANALQSQAGISLNQAAINAVHTQYP